MNKKRLLNQIAGILGIALLVGGIGALGGMYGYRQAGYSELAQMTGYIASHSPKDSRSIEEWMYGIKQSDFEDQKKGKVVLEKYGYTLDNIPLMNTNGPIFLSFSVAGVMALALIAMLIKRERSHQKRIEALSLYLKETTEGKNDVRVLGKEDEYTLLEDEIYKTIGELYQTRQLAVYEKGILRDHLADVAHQLKTPITSMSVMCDLLEEALSDDEQALYAKKIECQITRMEQLVHSLLILSKIEAKVIELEKKPVEVYILILRVLELLEPLLMSKSLMIEIKPEEDHTVIFSGDMKWSIEALYNLVKNCIEHTPDGKRIRICYAKTPLFTEIVVEDEGEGFAKEDIPYLFKRFYKGKNAREDSVGIGLALAEAIIKAQNGMIEAENRKEGGARFRMKLYPR